MNIKNNEKKRKNETSEYETKIKTREIEISEIRVNIKFVERAIAKF
jgi:hypothetical protein